MWKFILKEMLWMVDKNAVLQAIRAITDHYEGNSDDGELIGTLDEMPSPAGYLKNDWDQGAKGPLRTLAVLLVQHKAEPILPSDVQSRIRRSSCGFYRIGSGILL